MNLWSRPCAASHAGSKLLAGMAAGSSAAVVAGGGCAGAAPAQVVRSKGRLLRDCRVEFQEAQWVTIFGRGLRAGMVRDDFEAGCDVCAGL